ncbi:MAG: hypothetical protein ACRYFU_11375 [Janthinobacterium lividum]
MRSSNLKSPKLPAMQGRTISARRPPSSRERDTFWVPGDPEAIRPLVRGEGMPVFVASVLLALVALGVSYRHGYTLLYGDAVAHLGNARRILDSQYPGLAQLGGAWLPLPHILMLPFISNMAMWQTGLAAAPMAMLSFAASVVGVWRLSRRMMRLRWALVGTLFYALNPNLLYLATTAMTETLFLALFVWSVVITVEGVAAMRAGNSLVARPRMFLAGLLVLLMVFTRYDGWIMGAAVWCCFAWQMLRGEAAFRRKLLPSFVLFTTVCAAGPLLWFWYNAHFDGDWLDFMRGPYSAKQIEQRTAPPGLHYRGWHNPGWSTLFYLRTAQVDAATWETGWLLLTSALCGVWLTMQRRLQSVVRGRAEGLALLLWLPLPFYIYSIAFGSVPIFIPQLWPHAFYNARYGMELLPALCVYAALAGEGLDVWLRAGTANLRRWGARFWQPAAMVLCVLNSLLMMDGLGSAGFLRSHATVVKQAREAMIGGYLPEARRYALPLVLAEGVVNAQTRVPFEHSLATVLQTMPVDQPVLLSISAHVGAVQDAARELRTVLSENDETAWNAALGDPAGKAAYVIALEGDPVAKAVQAHPQGLSEIEVVRTVGQPTARIYQSLLYKRQATH